MSLVQREKLYDAEDDVRLYWRWMAPEGAQLWLNQRIRRKWWRSVSKVRHCILVYPHTAHFSETTLEGDVLTLKIVPDGLYDCALVHESTHGLVWYPGDDDEKDHNKIFAGALLETYRHWISAELADLVEARFAARGVKWTPYK